MTCRAASTLILDMSVRVAERDPKNTAESRPGAHAKHPAWQRVIAPVPLHCSRLGRWAHYANTRLPVAGGEGDIGGGYVTVVTTKVSTPGSEVQAFLATPIPSTGRGIWKLAQACM